MLFILEKEAHNIIKPKAENLFITARKLQSVRLLIRGEDFCFALQLRRPRSPGPVIGNYGFKVEIAN